MSPASTVTSGKLAQHTTAKVQCPNRLGWRGGVGAVKGFDTVKVAIRAQSPLAGQPSPAGHYGTF